MRIKKEIPIILCLFVVTTFILVRGRIFSSSEARVCVDPTEKTVYPDDTFTINVNVTSVSAIEAYSLIIYYHTIPVDGVSVEFPSGHFFEPSKHEELLVTDMDIDDNYNATHGMVWVITTLLGPESPKNGSGTLTTITFNATTLNGPSPLKLIYPGFMYPVKLSDPDANAIACTASDGTVKVVPEFPTPAAMLLALIGITVAMAIHKRKLPKTSIR